MEVPLKTIAIALCCLILSGSSNTYLEGDVRWLATDECSFPTADECALEAHAKAVLRDGRVRVDIDPVTKNEIERWGRLPSE